MTDQMIGAALGSGLGLISILIGALWNAHLNRRRDDRLRKGELKSLCGALLGDLCGTIVSLNECVIFLEGAIPKAGYPLKERLSISDSVIMQPGSRKMELLPTELARQVAYGYRAFELSRNLLNVCIKEHENGVLEKDMVKTRVYFLKQYEETLGEMAEALAMAAGEQAFWNKQLENPFFGIAVRKSPSKKKADVDWGKLADDY